MSFTSKGGTPDIAEYQNVCIQACLDCFRACERCAGAALAAAEMVEVMSDAGRRARDGADICTLCAALVARHSELHLAVAALCAAACEHCAEECERQDQRDCQTCAAACRRCAEACRQLAETATRAA